MHVATKYLDQWDSPLPTPELFRSWEAYEQAVFLIRMGNLAPSTHNTQPWRFQIDAPARAITILVDRAKILPESDVVGRQAAVSLGCAIENIVVAAEALGVSPSVTVFPVEKGTLAPGKKGFEKTALPVATVTFSASNSAEPSDVPLSSLRTRKILRTEFNPSIPVDERTIAEMKAVMLRFPRVSLHMVTDPIHRLAIAEFQGQADGFVLNSPRFARELGAWLYGNEAERGDGMPGNTFGLDDVQAERFHRGLLGTGTLEPEDMLRFSLGGKVGFEKSPLIVFLTSKSDELADWIESGRALQHIWLLLEKHGYAVAIHAAIVEVRLINRIFATTLGTTEPLSSVFRVGKPLDPGVSSRRPHSPRVPIEDLIERMES